MATTTTKFKLRKPAPTDNIDVSQDVSGNMDKIDNLAVMNRRVSTDAEPAIYWDTDGKNIFHIDVPTVFSDPPQLSAITTRNKQNTDMKWQPLIYTKAPSQSNITYNAAILYSTSSYAWAPYSGLCFIGAMSTGGAPCQMVWAGGKLNVKNFAICRVRKYENSAWAEYIVVYAYKLDYTGTNRGYAHALTILSQWTNSNVGEVAKLWLDATVKDDNNNYIWPQLDSIDPTSAPENPSEGDVYVYSRFYSTIGTLTDE